MQAKNLPLQSLFELSLINMGAITSRLVLVVTAAAELTLLVTLLEDITQVIGK